MEIPICCSGMSDLECVHKKATTMLYNNNTVNMELPICIGTYSNECEWKDVGFLKDVIQFVNEYTELHRTYFVGHCYYCNGFGTLEKRLKRCGGCQLVAYCSRDCQKGDWYTHKSVCKEFPVVNGKSALHSTRPWKEHLDGLCKRASRVKHAEFSAMPIFRNPRVCNTCREANHDCLTDCKCGCVSYCNKNCAKADKQHKEDCSHLGHISTLYLLRYYADPPSVRQITLCKKFALVSSWSDIISRLPPKCDFVNYLALPLVSVNDSRPPQLNFYYLIYERLSSPMTLLYALQMLPNRHLRHNHLPLEKLKSLTVHVVTSNPLFDSEPWEVFMHRLPKLKQLKVVFVMHGKALTQSFNLNIGLSLKRCKDCENKNRLITYSVQKMQYHMFFSSSKYTEPDVVVVFGNSLEMSSNEKEDINSAISYRNMTYSRDTVLVLTDVTKDLVTQGARDVNVAQTVDQLVIPQINPFKGFSINRAVIDSDVAVINEKYYFTCLRRK